MLKNFEEVYISILYHSTTLRGTDTGNSYTAYTGKVASLYWDTPLPSRKWRIWCSYYPVNILAADDLVIQGSGPSITQTIDPVNTLRPRQNGRHFADGIFKCIFLNENVCIPIKISLKFVPKGPINIPALGQIMAWCPPGDKPLSEPMMVSLLTHICITWPQWVNTDYSGFFFFFFLSFMHGNG